MKALGYRHMIAYIQGLVSLEKAFDIMKRDTKRFARRQLTWFKAMEGVCWFRPEDRDLMLEKIRKFLGGEEE